MATRQRIEPTELMVVNDAPGDECRIAILEDNHLEELYSERAATATNVGNIYKGRVVNVEAAIQAAFIDYGRGANGFLHISDLHPRYFPGGDRVERVGKKIPRRERPPIQEALKRGDEVLIQVLKEGIGTKGPTLTSYLSIPGRLLVVMPDMDRVGVSRRVEDEDRRREMRRILDSLDLPDGFGFILRTAGFGQTKTELKRDVAYLMRLWKVMEKRIKSVGAPCELFTESDLLIRTLRDVLRPSVQAIVVDSDSAYERVTAFLQVIAPRSAPKVIRYRRATPIFHAFDIERQIELIHGHEVPLASGGRLVIEQTEALVAIDVNSGRSRRARDSETNAHQTNCEAVDEICRQLRLRDLGGLIINDLIDMRLPRHRRSIEERFRNNLKRDRARTTILRISDFGLLEMTRQRMRPSLRKAHFMSCPQCDGHGEIKSPESVASDVTRQVSYLLNHARIRRVEIVCSPRVASVLLSRKRRELVHLEEGSGKQIDVRVSDDIALDRVDYYAYDERNADVEVSRLPTPSMPKLQDLEKDGAKAGEAAETPAEEGKSGRRRRSRRRRSGPADATAIALAGGFEEDGEPTAEPAKAASPSKKRGRGRRRRGKAAPTPADEAAVEASPEEEAPLEPPVRIHELARQLDVTSREVLERCRADGGIEVKNHMSSVSGETAAVIRGWFSRDGTAPETTEDTGSESETGRRRRRRRRGGRRRSGRGRGETAETPPDEAAKPDEAAVEADDEPVASEGEPAGEGRGKRRRSRRGRRSRRATGAEAAGDTPETAVTEATPVEETGEGAVKGEEAQGSTKKKRRRVKKKKSAKQEPPSGAAPETADGEGQDDAAAGTSKSRTGSKSRSKPKSKVGGRRKTKTKATGTAATVAEGVAEPGVPGNGRAGAEGDPAETPRSRRSPLYRTRKVISPTVRVATEAPDR